ncbi:MAG TPA: PhzF family phenazine biosynthesis protein [Kofleriaceae bacterium]|jgi:PhzF family phenazine biosynthesis protein
MIAFRIVNVFTVGGDPFSGNPLCVVEDARGLEPEQMQSIARQMNLSETTFVLPSERADARVRIFTPGFEMPFAGHPTLGTASVVGEGRDEIDLEMLAGIITVTRSGDEWTLTAAGAPSARPAGATRAELASMLSLDEAAIAGEPLWVHTGVEQLVIPLRSADDVRAAKPIPSLLERWGYTESRHEAMAYVWAPAAEGPWPVRFFFTSNGAVLEDPATGSACANLGGWHVVQKRGPLAATLRQGEAVGRPSELKLRVDANGAIHVTGAVIALGRGALDL